LEHREQRLAVEALAQPEQQALGQREATYVLDLQTRTAAPSYWPASRMERAMR